MNGSWPMQMDMGMVAPNLDGQGQQQQQQMQGGTGNFGNSGGVFMGSDVGGGLPI